MSLRKPKPAVHAASERQYTAASGEVKEPWSDVQW